MKQRIIIYIIRMIMPKTDKDNIIKVCKREDKANNQYYKLRDIDFHELNERTVETYMLSRYAEPISLRELKIISIVMISLLAISMLSIVSGCFIASYFYNV